MNTSNITNYKPKNFAELVGVSVKTLQCWDREGTLKTNRRGWGNKITCIGNILKDKWFDSKDFFVMAQTRDNY